MTRKAGKGWAVARPAGVSRSQVAALCPVARRMTDGELVSEPDAKIAISPNYMKYIIK
jgi:hypothetical protein